MNELLKSSFRSEELALGAAIGAQDSELAQKVETLFRELPDPILSATDVLELLILPSEGTGLTELLNSMVASGVLESSSTTIRPKDPDGTVLYRIAGSSLHRLRLTALEARLSDGTSRFQFTCDGRLIRSIARVDRLDALGDTGQQREEIATHVDGIAAGIAAGTQVQNSLLLVIVDSQFAEEGESEDAPPESFVILRPQSDFLSAPHPLNTTSSVQDWRVVELDFPYRAAAFDDEKAALLVDGQQRTAALSFVDVDTVPQFAFSVNAVVSDAESAKTIFKVANNTVKISTQFARALSASMTDAPGYLREEQLIAKAVKQLVLTDKSSPFAGLVQYPGAKKAPKPPIAYNSLFQVMAGMYVGGGFTFDGPEQLAAVAKRGFLAVKTTWPEEWGRKPAQSKLMHGIGLRALGSLLVGKLEARATATDYDSDLLSDSTWGPIEKSVARLKDVVVWSDDAAAKATKSAAKFYRDKLATRQNTNQDIAAFSGDLKKESLNQDLEANKKAMKGKK